LIGIKRTNFMRSQQRSSQSLPDLLGRQISFAREALGNKRDQSSPRPYLFRLSGFDADRRLFSLFPPVFRLIRASMG